ncbi:hypothetical protein D3C73_1020750 [compost metagenome]
MRQVWPIRIGKPEAYFLAAEVRDHDKRLPVSLSCVSEHFGMSFIKPPEYTFYEYRMLLAQCNQLPVMMVDGTLIAQLLLHIDIRITLIDLNPWRTGGESGIRTVIPLHRGARIVP